MADIDFNALGQAIDTTWGRSSTTNAASFSVKFKLEGEDLLCATYAVVVNFGSERQMIEMKRRYREEADAIINEALKGVKASYKDLTGSALKVKEHNTPGSGESLEIIGVNFYNPRRTAHYRKKMYFGVA
jgi:hypothetical protein